MPCAKQGFLRCIQCAGLISWPGQASSCPEVPVLTTDHICRARISAPHEWGRKGKLHASSLSKSQAWSRMAQRGCSTCVGVWVCVCSFNKHWPWQLVNRALLTSWHLNNLISNSTWEVEWPEGKNILPRDTIVCPGEQGLGQKRAGTKAE